MNEILLMMKTVVFARVPNTIYLSWHVISIAACHFIIYLNRRFLIFWLAVSDATLKLFHVSLFCNILYKKSLIYVSNLNRSSFEA